MKIYVYFTKIGQLITKLSFILGFVGNSLFYLVNLAKEPVFGETTIQQFAAIIIFGSLAKGPRTN